MQRRGFVGCLCGLAGQHFAAAQERPEFGYAGTNGPDHWGRLQDQWAACATGRNQSPIALSSPVPAALAPVQLDYPSFGTELVHTGHTLQVNVAPGSWLRLDGRAFMLRQFHFHAPCEHRMGGRDFPLEAHLVHGDAGDNLAVVAILFDIGPANDLIDLIWAGLPTSAGQASQLGDGITPRGLLPPTRDYYRYSGSLTTPPCSEGVLWILMRQPMTASRGQIDDFTRAIGFANNRPVQPLNARALLQARGG